MKKKAVKKGASKTKGFFRKAGEVIGTIGHDLAQGKDKVVEVSQTIIEGVSHVIRPAKKKVVKKVNKKNIKKTDKNISRSKVAVKKDAEKIAKNQLRKKRENNPKH
jgi:hypothetical protein